MPRRRTKLNTGRRTRTKNSKKLGKHGEVVISTFDGAVNALRNRYRSDFPDLVLFSHFNAMGKNFVFQKIQSFPLREITYAPETHSIEFNAKWISGGALPYLFPKESFEVKSKESGKEVGWGEVANFFPLARFGQGLIRANKWVEIHEADDIKAVIDIRIDGIKSINMYDWGFELIGDVISFLAINKNVALSEFPRTIALNVEHLSFEFGKMTGKEVFEVRWSEPGYEPIRQTTTNFDKILFGDDGVGETPELKIKDLGQRCMKNLILDED